MGLLKLRSAISYGAVCGSAFWALTQSYTEGAEDYWTCSNLAYALISIHSMVGFWKFSRANGNARVFRYYKLLTFFANIFTVPLICVDMYMYSFYPFEIAYLHLFYPTVAFYCWFSKRKPHFANDLVTFLSLSSLSFISAMHKNYYGLWAGVTHASAHFVLGKAGRSIGVNSKDAQNYLMAFFVYFSLRALVTAESSWMMSYPFAKQFKKIIQCNC